ncbi:hypothetical protein [Planomicrobium okeanokoites]|nr:hypothetical protein [Planomicrobium okeanokoites]
MAKAGEDKSLRRSSAAMQEHIFSFRRLLLYFNVEQNPYISIHTF